MKENNGIILAGGDASVYLAKPMHKKYSLSFAWGHPFSAYVSPDRFFNPLPCKHMYAFRVIFAAIGLPQKILLNFIAHMF